MNDEMNMMEINEVVETGTELVTEVVKNNGLMKKIGIGAVYAVAGALVYEGSKRVIKFAKSKFKKKNTNEIIESEFTDETNDHIAN